MVSMIPPTPSPGKKIKASDMFFPEQLSLPHIRRVSIRNIYAKSMGELLSSVPSGSIDDWKSIALNALNGISSSTRNRSQLYCTVAIMQVTR